MFFKGSCFTILGYSITPFGGDSNHVEFNQFICIASWLLGFYAMWDFLEGVFEHSVIFSFFSFK